MQALGFKEIPLIPSSAINIVKHEVPVRVGLIIKGASLVGKIETIVLDKNIPICKFLYYL